MATVINFTFCNRTRPYFPHRNSVVLFYMDLLCISVMCHSSYSTPEVIIDRSIWPREGRQKETACKFLLFEFNLSWDRPGILIFHLYISNKFEFTSDNSKDNPRFRPTMKVIDQLLPLMIFIPEQYPLHCSRHN